MVPPGRHRGLVSSVLGLLRRSGDSGAASGECTRVPSSLPQSGSFTLLNGLPLGSSPPSRSLGSPPAAEFTANARPLSCVLFPCV